MMTQTIAQLHGLETDDSWDRRSDADKQRDTARQELRDNSNPTPVRKSVFIDPPDDENWVIREGSDRVFYRLSVTKCKLGELLKLEPSLLDIGVTARNTANGCWVALTSRRVAEHIAQRLQPQGLLVTLAIVNSMGESLDYTLNDAQREAVHRGLGK